MIAEIMVEQVSPIQRAQAEGWNAGGCGAGQRQIADVGKDEVGLEFGEKTRLIGDTGWPVGVRLTIGRGAGFQVDVGGVDHHVAEIGGVGDQRVGCLDPLLQLGGGQGAADGQPEIRGSFGDGIEHRRRDGEVAEAVTGNVDKQVHAGDFGRLSGIATVNRKFWPKLKCSGRHCAAPGFVEKG